MEYKSKIFAFMKPKKEQKTPAQIGDVRTNKEGKKEVLISTRPQMATNELLQLENVINYINYCIIDDLRAIGLADSLEEICMNCNLTPDGLKTNLAAKYLKSGKLQDELVAKVYAREAIDEALKAGRIKEFNPLALRKSHLINKYGAYLELTADGIVIVSKANFMAQFENWATGKKAEKFARLYELIKEFNSLTNKESFRSWENWMHFFQIKEDGIQLCDNWELNQIAD